MTLREKEACGPELALIVGPARSGTTLLRLLLDAHPEIGCPAEAGVPALMSHLASVWLTIEADQNDGVSRMDLGIGSRPIDPGARREHGVLLGETVETSAGGPPLPSLTPEALEWIATTVMAPMGRYCNRSAKRLYCDKSLDSVFHLALVNEVFPRTRAVLAFRHVMDTVASGIEASPWGFQGYGYAPYVQSSPQNFVAALVNYWLHHTEAALKWEQSHPEDCIRVRYEDLVQRPAETILGVFGFLGVGHDLSVLSRAFDRDPTKGPGDFKIAHTTEVHTTSLGRGKRVPVSMIPPPLLSAVNEKLALLGYDELTSAWNVEEHFAGASNDRIWGSRLLALMNDSRLNPLKVDGGWTSLALIADDHKNLRWVVDLQNGIARQGDGDVEAAITGSAQDLVLMITREENLGILLRAGRIRHVTAGSNDSPFELIHVLDAFVASFVDPHELPHG